MSNVTFKHHQQVRDYGSVLANNNKQVEMIDEESHELLKSSADKNKPAPSLRIESAGDVAVGEESYGSSFQFGDSSSTNGSLKTAETASKKISSYSIRDIAMNLSLYVNLAILAGKTVVYMRTMSLAVLASLLDSLLDVVSQLVLYYTERNSEQRSSDHYPAGAARLEPIGVLTCAALMGMASFEVLKESIQALVQHENTLQGQSWSSVWNMLLIVVIKLFLLVLCQKAGEERATVLSADSSAEKTTTVVLHDSTMEALALDHLNDCLSNAVAAIALVAAISRPWLWWVDPVGAIAISAYIIYSWFSTGREQIEHLTGKAAPKDFVEELREIASNHDSRVVVDVCRAYHFGPKFLVELEIVLPKETLLFESHDIGMDLQYEIEAREEVER